LSAAADAVDIAAFGDIAAIASATTVDFDTGTVFKAGSSSALPSIMATTTAAAADGSGIELW
jgi:hypothetical protein